MVMGCIGMEKTADALKYFVLWSAWAGVLLLNGCSTQDRTGATPPPAPQLVIAPLEKNSGSWRIAASDQFTVTVTAPGATSIRLLYQPEDGSDRTIELGKARAATDAASSDFQFQVEAVPDFAGEVLAEVSYPNGEQKQTAPVLLTTRTALGAKPAGQSKILTEADKEAKTRLRVTVNSEESAREDRLTSGRIERAPLQPNDPRLAITINIPAFQLTLWQNGREVKTYQIGIGRRDFPLPTGEREATSIIFNPRWVPPDSDWVQQSGRVQPFEQIEPDDPRNPLGKIKIPLGDAYLIHQAAKPTDIGHLVSHGCARLLEADLFDLAEKIIAARSLPLSREEIEQARTTSERKVAQLNTPLPVDLNYDTQVVEGGVLHLYPDVYEHDTNTVEQLRQELMSYGFADSMPDDETLRQMLKRVSATEAFLVNLRDIRAGRALSAGWNEPLVNKPVKNPTPRSTPSPHRHQAGTKRRP